MHVGGYQWFVKDGPKCYRTVVGARTQSRMKALDVKGAALITAITSLRLDPACHDRGGILGRGGQQFEGLVQSP